MRDPTVFGSRQMSHMLLLFGSSLTKEIHDYLAKKAKFTISIGKPRNTALNSKISHEPYLHMKMPNKVQIQISNGPELIGTNVLYTCLSHSHTGMVSAK